MNNDHCHIQNLNITILTVKKGVAASYCFFVLLLFFAARVKGLAYQMDITRK